MVEWDLASGVWGFWLRRSETKEARADFGMVNMAW